MKRRLYLNFPKDLVEKPIIFELGHEFKVITNIRGASISEDAGLVALELSGETAELERAILWLKGKGLEVEELKEPDN